MTVRTTPGRPWLARGILLAALAAAAGLAWAVVYYRSHQPIALAGPRSAGEWLIRLPRDWVAVEQVERGDGELAFAFMEPPRRGGGRVFRIQRFSGPIAGPVGIWRYFLQGRGLSATIQAVKPARIGPLPARQATIIADREGQGRRQIVRLAVVGLGQYLAIGLERSGPLTAWEDRLLEAVAASVAPNPQRFFSVRDLADERGLRLGGSADDWLAAPVASPVRLSEQVALLPRASDVSPAGGFWGHARLTVMPVQASQKAEDLIRDFADSGLGDAEAPPTLPLPFGPSMTLSIHPASVERIGAPSRPGKTGPEAGGEGGGQEDTLLWRARSSARELLRLTCLFHPRDESGSAALDRVVWLQVWTCVDEAAAASGSVERLAGDMTLLGAAFDTDLTVARDRGVRWLRELADKTLEFPKGDLAFLATDAPRRAPVVGLLEPEAGLWRQRTLTLSSEDDVLYSSRWDYPGREGAFAQTIMLYRGGQLLAQCGLVVRPTRLQINWAGQEDRSAPFDRPADFMPCGLLWPTIEAVAAANRPTQGRQPPSSGMLCFQALGPSARRLATLCLRPAGWGPSDRPAAVLWADYDPEPTIVRLDGGVSLERDLARWRPLAGGERQELEARIGPLERFVRPR